MTSADELVANAENANIRYCFAKAGQVYLVYLPSGGTAELDLGKAPGTFSINWFNPRRGGPLRSGSVAEAQGGAKTPLGQPPAEPGQDWLVIVRR
jgi:hypothetical protein